MCKETGREIKTNTGVFLNINGERTIGIKRCQLTDLKEFVTTYAHERGHDITNCSDNARGFTNFFEKIAARYMMRQLQQEQKPKLDRISKVTELESEIDLNEDRIVLD